MTGTGTSTDPYVVDNFADFLTAAGTSGTYVAFDPDAENKVLDVNDTPYATGFTSPIYLNAASIRGNGWIIRNLLFRGSFYAIVNTNCTVESLHFENIVTELTGYAVIRCNGNPTWKDCSFGGYISHTPSNTLVVYGSDQASKFVRCSFSFESVGTGTVSYLLQGCVYDCCYFWLNCDFPASSYSQTMFYNAKLSNCMIRGRSVIQSGAVNMTQSCSIGYTYFAYELKCADSQTNPVTVYFEAGASTGVCFYDASLLGEGVTGVIRGNALYALTTEQCKDAAYLTSIGFPCAGEGS